MPGGVDKSAACRPYGQRWGNCGEQYRMTQFRQITVTGGSAERPILILVAHRGSRIITGEFLHPHGIGRAAKFRHYKICAKSYFDDGPLRYHILYDSRYVDDGRYC